MRYSLLIALLSVMYGSVQAEDLRYLSHDSEKVMRSELYKQILGFDYTKPETSAEIAIDRSLREFVVIDTLNADVDPLPEEVLLFMGKPVPFKRVIQLISATYGFKPIFKNLSDSKLNQLIIINQETNDFATVMTYLEQVTSSNITIWPRGGGSTVLVTDINE